MNKHISIGRIFLIVFGAMVGFAGGGYLLAGRYGSTLGLIAYMVLLVVAPMIQAAVMIVGEYKASSRRL